LSVVDELAELVGRISTAVAPLEHCAALPVCVSPRSEAPAPEADGGGGGGDALWDGVEVELNMADLGV
jgi:hypothetical protein